MQRSGAAACSLRRAPTSLRGLGVWNARGRVLKLESDLQTTRIHQTEFQFCSGAHASSGQPVAQVFQGKGSSGGESGTHFGAGSRHKWWWGSGMVLSYLAQKKVYCMDQFHYYKDDDEYDGVLPKEGVLKIATLINALVDLDYFTEEEEQEIFEHAVMCVLEVIERILPPPIMKLVVETDYADGVPDDMAATLKERLIEYVKWNVKLPYLDSTDESRVVAAVCAVIVESMRKGSSFDHVVEPVNSAELIIDVFVKGSVGILDTQNKQEVVESICEDLQIPFVPDRVKMWVVGSMVHALGEVFEQSIFLSYQMRVSSAYDAARERLDDARESEIYKAWHNLPATPWYSRLFNHAPKTADAYVARIPEMISGRFFDEDGVLNLPQVGFQGDDDTSKFGEEVRDLLVAELNNRIDVIGWLGGKFEEWEGVVIRHIVDLTLMQSMDMDKMEGSVAYLYQENFASALRYEWYESMKADKFPVPPGWKDYDWYWEVSVALAERDVKRIAEKPISEERHLSNTKGPMKQKKQGKKVYSVLENISPR